MSGNCLTNLIISTCGCFSFHTNNPLRNVVELVWHMWLLCGVNWAFHFWVVLLCQSWSFLFKMSYCVCLFLCAVNTLLISFFPLSSMFLWYLYCTPMKWPSFNIRYVTTFTTPRLYHWIDRQLRAALQLCKEVMFSLRTKKIRTV